MLTGVLAVLLTGNKSLIILGYNGSSLSSYPPLYRGFIVNGVGIGKTRQEMKWNTVIPTDPWRQNTHFTNRYQLKPDLCSLEKTRLVFSQENLILEETWLVFCWKYLTCLNKSWPVLTLRKPDLCHPSRIHDFLGKTQLIATWLCQ